MTRLIPAILCGGSGTRLWPLSRAAEPKQLHALVTERSMLAETIARCAGAADVALSDVVLIAGAGIERRVAEEADKAGAYRAAIVLEPHGRNTAPAAAMAAFLALEHGADAQVLLAPSDAHIENTAAFAQAVAAASAIAAEGAIVTFGVEPTAPHTGYGYIQAGAAWGAGRKVAKFHEKPKAEVAEQMLAAGAHYWNAGLFLFQAAAFLRELKALAPEIHDFSEAAFKAARREGRFLYPEETAWAQAPAISIDYAVAEKTAQAAVVPVDMGWSDVGSWSTLWEIAEKDAAGNALQGDVVAPHSRNCFVRSDQARMVALAGCQDLIVIDTADAVLIMPRDSAQAVKDVVEALKARERKDLL